MKKVTLLLTSIALATLTLTPAAAADVRPYAKAPAIPAPVLTWAGFYLGVQGGGGWGTSDATYIRTPNSTTFLGTQNFNASGGFAGGVLGYNWQAGSFVVGIEGDYHWANINGRSGVINVGPPSLGDSYFTQLRSFGEIKGRLGYAAGPALYFVSGGAAVGDFQHRYDRPLSFSSLVQNGTQSGWTLGGGMEYMFAQHWSAKVEYNYLDFGKSTLSYSALPGDRTEWTDTIHTVKAGINYHFN